MQEKVNQLIKSYHLSCGVQNRYIDLVSEVGELGKEILKETAYGEKAYAVNETSLEEMGDCIFSLLALCSEMGIMANEALDYALAKYQKRLIEKGHIGSK